MQTKVYPQMNTLVRLAERTLLTQSQRFELVNAADLGQFLKLLSATDFFALDEPDSPQEFNSAFENEQNYWLLWAEKLSPDADIAGFFKLADSLVNIRAYVKETALQRDFTSLYIDGSQLNKSGISAIMTAEKLSERERRIKTAIADATAAYTASKSLSRADLHIIFFGHGEFFRLADEIADKEITNFIKAKIDLEILSILLQAREENSAVGGTVLAKIEGGNINSTELRRLFSATASEQDSFIDKTLYGGLWEQLKHQGFDLFDVYADNFLMEKCKSAKLEAFGLFPLFAFLYAKLLDIKNVRMIAAAKRAGAGSAEISERLRGGYEI